MRALTLATVSITLLALTGCAQEYGLGHDEGPPGGLADDGGQVGDDDDDDNADDWLYGDSWDLSGGVSSDVIIYGDTSGSMEAELLTMADNILAFTDRLQENASDWHLMAVTGPSGCAVNGWMTQGTPAFDNLFADAIITKPVPDTEDEMGLQNVRNAVEQSFGGCNAGFLRDDALLHILFVSDENDESPGFQTEDYWTDYVDEIIALKGSASMVKFSAVAGPTPNGCAGADAGDGYSEVVDATNGEFISICTDWPTRIDTLADASVNTTVFELSKTPVVSTLEVLVNQNAVTGTWTYVPSGNLVRFDSDAPKTGDIVDINYEIK